MPSRSPFSVGSSRWGGRFQVVFVLSCYRSNREGLSLIGGKQAGAGERADLGELDGRGGRPDHAVAVDRHQQRRGRRAVGLRGGLGEDAAAFQPGRAEGIRDVQVTLRAGGEQQYPQAAELARMLGGPEREDELLAGRARRLDKREQG